MLPPELGARMRRREFLGVLSAVAAWPVTARAQQQGRMRRIGFLSSYTAEAGREIIGCFRKGLEQLGWVEGQNISVEYRWAEARSERYSVLATELTRLNLDLIACNSTPATQALQRTTHRRRRCARFGSVTRAGRRRLSVGRDAVRIDRAQRLRFNFHIA
jgi:hypothetical protein